MSTAARRFLTATGPRLTALGHWRSSLSVGEVAGRARSVRAAAFNAAAAQGGGAGPVEVSIDGPNWRLTFDGSLTDVKKALAAGVSAAETVLRPVRVTDGCTGCHLRWGAPGSEGQCRRCSRCLRCCDDDRVTYSCAERRSWLERKPGAAERSDRARAALENKTWREPGTSASDAWGMRKR